MSNAVWQTIGGFPSFVLYILIVVLLSRTRGSADTGKKSYFLHASMAAMMLSFIGSSLWHFRYPSPNTDQLIAFSHIHSVVNGSAYLLLLYGIAQLILGTDTKKIRANQNVFVTVLLTFFTAGFYTPYWYIKQHLTIRSAGNDIILLSASMAVYFYTTVQNITSFKLSDPPFSPILFPVLLILTTGLGIISALLLRQKLLNFYQARIEINLFLTLLFGVFYLQYKINTVTDEYEAQDSYILDEGAKSPEDTEQP